MLAIQRRPPYNLFQEQLGYQQIISSNLLLIVILKIKLNLALQDDFVEHS